MSKILYNALFLVGLICVLPRMLWDQFRFGKYKHTWKAKWGFALPVLPAKTKKRIWIHAVSMGETRALIPLLPQLLQEAEIVISSGTTTGHTEAKRCLPQVIAHFYLPFDLSWIMRKYVTAIQPDLLVFCESDFWYQLLSAAKERGVPTAIINGKISQVSTHRFLKFPFRHYLFNLIDLFCVQNEEYADRFLSLGVPSAKISVTGNLKFDVEPPHLSDEEKAKWQERFHLSPKDRVIVIGSSHTGEEAMLLKAIQPVLQQVPHLKILVVPRHPERFQEVEELIKCEYPDAILVKAMGILNTCYQLADIAIVAGSFISTVGGHNIFEPIYFRVPVLFGPHMHSQEELTQLVLKSQAGRQVSLEELPDLLLTLLQNSKDYESMAQAGGYLAAQMRGAALRTYKSLQEIIHGKSSPSI